MQGAGGGLACFERTVQRLLPPVEINRQDRCAFARQRDQRVEGESGLADPAFLVGESDDMAGGPRPRADVAQHHRWMLIHMAALGTPGSAFRPSVAICPDIFEHARLPPTRSEIGATRKNRPRLWIS